MNPPGSGTPVKASAYVATSLDGFISRADGSIDWLDRANAVLPAGEDCGFGEFMQTVDVLVMGRHSFEKVLTLGAWPYGETRVIVLSRSGVTIPGALASRVSASSEAPAALVARLSAEGARHLYVDGGLTIQGFLRAGLIDEITLTVVPVLLGAGRPLFGPLEDDLALTHLSTIAYPFGYVQSRYRVKATA